MLQIQADGYLVQLGAGIQLPPNATRIVTEYFGLLDKIRAAGAVKLDLCNALDYRTGDLIAKRPGPAWAEKWFGHSWHVLLRADYQRVLFDEAKRLGVQVRLDCDVVDVECKQSEPLVLLANGEAIEADVIVGADGIGSTMRACVLGYQKDAQPSGDMGYRATIPRVQLEQLNDPSLAPVLQKAESFIWWGPDMHAMLYPVANCEMFNIALIVPSDLPEGVRKLPADIEQMRKIFEGWDPRLNAIIRETETVFKWQLHHMKELDTWTRGAVALLGDACHPTLPYQAQGAAMAVEDGATIGKLLGLYTTHRNHASNLKITEVLKLYEDIRKRRTTLNVTGADQNRTLYHLHEPEASRRNEQLKQLQWDRESNDCPWLWGDMEFMRYINGFNTVAEAEKAFRRRLEGVSDSEHGTELEQRLLQRLEMHKE